jgi:hypothetical protein
MTPVAGASLPQVKQMWPGGPLRRFSPIRKGGCQLPLEGGGFGGSYVCEGCQVPVAGVYRVIDRVERRESWVCAGCKTQREEAKSRTFEESDLADRTSPSQAEMR